MMTVRQLSVLSLLCLSACAASPPAPTPAAPTASVTSARGAPTPTHAPTATAQPVTLGARAEYRAFWVDAFHPGIKSPQEVEQLIRDMHAAHANVVFAQVRKRGDAYYSQTSEPRADDLKVVPDYDPLAYLIQQAHAANPPIEVHAWLNALIVARATEMPTTTLHVVNQHGPNAQADEQWLSKNSTGALSSDSYYFLDPGHPQAAQYTADVFLDVIRHYDLDGIHLDYIRYAGAQWGYNAVSVARFNAATQTSGVPSAKDARWMQWRRDQVTALTRQIYLEAIALKPKLKVSAALIAWGSGPVREDDWARTSAYGDVLQDWTAWLREGIVDIAVPMNYDTERNAQHKQWYDQWIEWEKNHRAGRHLVVGLGAFMNDLDGTVPQVQRALAPAASGQTAQGVSFFSYGETDARGLAIEKFFRALTQPDEANLSARPVFAENARVPEMTWKMNPTSGHLKGMAHFADGRPADGVSITLSGPATRTLTVAGTGFFGAAHLPPGGYTLSVIRNGKSLASATATVKEGVVTSINFLQLPME